MKLGFRVTKDLSQMNFCVIRLIELYVSVRFGTYG